MDDKEIREAMITAREEYIDLIKSELLGPGSEFSLPDKEHEIISASPISRYSVGILFPQGNLVDQDEDETVPIEENGDKEDSAQNSLENEAEDSNIHENISKSSKNRIKNHNYTLDETADENLDEEIGMSTQFRQSSMGITCIIQGNCETIHGKLDFATYRKAKISDCMAPYLPEDPENYKLPSELAHLVEYDAQNQLLRLKGVIKAKEIHDIFEKDTIPENEADMLKKIMYRFVDYYNNGFVREPHHISDFVLDFTENDYIDNDEMQNLDGTSAKLVALRRNIKNDIWSITIMLVNDLEENPATPQHCIYQAKLDIGTEDNNFVFVESTVNADPEDMDDEEQNLDLLYRHKKSYGTGLGTSVDWKIDSNGQGHIWNDFFPITEIPSMNFSLPANDFIQDDELSMKYLSDLSTSTKEQKLSSLHKLVDLYKMWVNELEKTAQSLGTRYQSAAIKNIDNCKRAYKRMYDGISTLESNSEAYQAFLLANRAMFMQRIHVGKQTEMATTKADRYPGDQEISEWLTNLDYRSASDRNCVWRPFQIAFLLMDINSIVLDDSEERSIVDLIWFPTGGGKTEAYLGLTAFTIFYRRLAYPQKSDGATVIMRYTLRLLAAQQFTRAATLICACEYIREDCLEKRSIYPQYKLGKTPITIGLWIGSSHIPNKNVGANSADEHLNKLINVTEAYQVQSEKERHNKFQVLKCPWCGTKMVKDRKDKRLVGEWGYAMRTQKGKHFYMFCPHEDCSFTNKLPIQIIDDELYENPPTLLFSTVDKFAMLPWDSRIGSFFAVDSTNRAPELIIQDELHLISGALGTIVGLFETSIDFLCGQKGISPKIIASTATIRKAKEQCSSLYNREVVQFPSPGLEAEDSFFAREAVINYEDGVYGRKYVGVMPSGKTKAMTEIRLMAALLQKLYTSDFPEAIKDKFWTLTVYFNSLKDLGKASTLVDDDVKDFIIRTANRMFTNRRLIVGSDELTSRVSTTELNETLDKLEKVEYSKSNIDAKRYASNILLATNMISVGIDVARLNTMLMVGQPKLTSEYIQASSRVGRSYPGVVFVQYDTTKSRDRSHYERFRSYHDSFYRFVEPTGVTPFSKPARERALHSILIAMLRYKGALSEDGDAKNFDKDFFANQISEIEEFILNRVDKINQRNAGAAPDNLNDIKNEINEVFDTWQRYVEESGAETLSFGKKYMVKPPRSGERRLLRQYHSQGRDVALNTLTSMRNVDAPVEGDVLIWENKND